MMTSQILKSVDFMLTQKSRILISKEDQNMAISGFLIFYRTDASKIETCG